MGLGGAGHAQGVKKNFFEYGHVAYQTDGADERNRIQVKSHYGQTGDLGVRSKILKIPLQSQFQRFFLYQTVCVLTNKRYKTY